MADTQLLPCPFCGGTDLSIETNSVQPDDFHDAWVNCGECNADGRHAMTLEGWLPSKAEAKEEAVVAWNRRAALASRPAEVDDWISVHDRLPEIGTKVLTAGFIYNSPGKSFWQDTALYARVGWVYEFQLNHYPPTHWRRLPEAPSHTTNKEK